MSYFVETRWSGSEQSPSPKRLQEILAELDVPDDEHPDTWLTHESGWTLDMFHSGLVVLRSPDDGAARHLQRVSRSRALELWLLLARGQIDALLALTWQPDEPRPSAAEMEKARVEAEAWTREQDRAFYDRLGPESSSERCDTAACARHRIALSVHCRTHHFESVRRRPCPFED